MGVEFDGEEALAVRVKHQNTLPLAPHSPIPCSVGNRDDKGPSWHLVFHDESAKIHRVGSLLSKASMRVQDVTISEDDDGWHATVPISPFPAGSFRPGRVIWAKVEGHDWWPARVVRRRAVPREVGPPPGGPARVRSQIPVVFFTSKGIPGEVGDDKQPSTPSGAHTLLPDD